MRSSRRVIAIMITFLKLNFYSSIHFHLSRRMFKTILRGFIIFTTNDLKQFFITRALLRESNFYVPQIPAN
jgi:hypothetical protein